MAQVPDDPGSPSTPVLSEAFWEEVVHFSLDAHRVGQHGFLRIRVQLPRVPKPLDAVVTLSGGDIQGFLAALQETRSIDLYIHREMSLS